VPFARSIDGHLAHHGLQALTPLRLRRKGGITLSDEKVRENARRPAVISTPAWCVYDVADEGFLASS
jgi:hypothetical protein